jgi:prepilin-type N-terminal cleavage/methylation domain-containing protein
MRRSSQQGFTLIEAAVAIAVVAILSGIIVPLVVKNLRDSQIARAKNDVQVIAAAIASQYKDTGTRPLAAGGPSGATGAGDAVWGSGGMGAAALTGSQPTNLVAPAATNSFGNVFTYSNTTGTLGMVLFGFPAATPVNTEFCFKGPYMSEADAAKTDPWGSRYVILGYSQNGNTNNYPMYVVCAGPDRSVLAANGVAVPVATWTNTGLSADDIVVRVN